MGVPSGVGVGTGVGEGCVGMVVAVGFIEIGLSNPRFARLQAALVNMTKARDKIPRNSFVFDI